MTIGDARARCCRRSTCSAQSRTRSTNRGQLARALPPASNQHVTLRDAAGSGARPLVVHPFGALEITQKVAPLDIAIQRFGATAPRRRQRVPRSSTSSSAARRDRRRRRAGGVRAGAVLRHERRREALAAVVRTTTTPASPIGGDTRRAADFMRERDVAYEVIYLPEHHPVRVRFGMPRRLSQFFVARRRGGAVVAVAGERARRRRSPTASPWRRNATPSCRPTT